VERARGEGRKEGVWHHRIVGVGRSQPGEREGTREGHCRTEQAQRVAPAEAAGLGLAPRGNVPCVRMGEGANNAVVTRGHFSRPSSLL
jgi:hypothetical protein